MLTMIPRRTDFAVEGLDSLGLFDSVTDIDDDIFECSLFFGPFPVAEEVRQTLWHIAAKPMWHYVCLDTDSAD